MWPGFGENSRVLKWIVERLRGEAEGVETPIGVLPAEGALDTTGLDISRQDLDLLLSVDTETWRHERPCPVPPGDLRRPHARRSCGTSTGPWWSAWGSAGAAARRECGRPRVGLPPGRAHVQ